VERVDLRTWDPHTEERRDSSLTAPLATQATKLSRQEPTGSLVPASPLPLHHPRPETKNPAQAGPLEQPRATAQPATTLTVRRRFGPFTENSTLPSTSANNVWSRPRP